MATAGLALNRLLNTAGVNAAIYFAAITLYSMICGAYIAYRVGTEDESRPSHRPQRRARRGIP